MQRKAFTVLRLFFVASLAFGFLGAGSDVITGPTQIARASPEELEDRAIATSEQVSAAYPRADSWGYPLDDCCDIIFGFGPDWWSDEWHGYHLANDLRANKDAPVKAVAAGVIARPPVDYTFGKAILIEHTLPDGHKVVSLYGHINPTVTSGEVVKGQQIGTLAQYDGGVNHLHFGIRDGPYQATATCPGWSKTNWPYAGYTLCVKSTGFHENSQCRREDALCDDYDYDRWWSPVQFIRDRMGNNKGNCPTSGGVILYWNAGFDCRNDKGNSGFVQVSEAGLYNIPDINPGFNDQASSIKVPDGWVVVLYENSPSDPRGLGGSSVQRVDNPDFAGDYFDNREGLNDKVSSFRVFAAGGGPENRKPNIPSPQSPSDGYVSRDGQAPTLCWNNSGDPDGNPVEFYAEVYDSPVNANSGWISATCWRPSQLDGQYNTYKWHVKARDVPYHAESEWSSTWRFSIEEPNKAPSISFDVANGDSFASGRIDSRLQNWTFRGTASDPEGNLSKIEFRCDGDSCGQTTRHEGLSVWQHDQAAMSGKNDVYFVAYDDRQSTASRHLDLNIDLASPQTTPSLNSEANRERWPEWFTSAVQVNLHAEDGNTGRARSGVKQIYRRLDGSPWQAYSGDTAAFTVSSDGPHTVDCYSVDNVDNQEGVKRITFKIDQTPPDPPKGVVETHGVSNNRWQKAQNTPTFRWAASTDTTSGLWGYQFYFGPEPDGVAYQTFLASDLREWTPQPGGVRTGTYYLRGRTRDNAGNWSVWTDLFVYRFDGTPPENPKEASHTSGISNDSWQRTTSQADFNWPVPFDEGSGIKGYYHYWGPNAHGTGADFSTSNSFQSATPLCGANSACTGYLRLRSIDNVDNLAEDWSTAFVLRYDNAPPVAQFTFRGTVTETNQTRVTLEVAATDEGSGVREMRLSNDGRNWADWEVYATERLWEIPAISRQWWPVYLQVRDGVGLASEVISRTVYLEVNPRQPRSANFRLFDQIASAGAAEHSSAPSGLQAHSTVGQVIDSAQASSPNYLIFGGYEAGSQAIPIVEPGHDEFTFINGVFASGTGASTSRSSQYRMLGTVGEVGLPNNETTLSSASHKHQPGFLAAVPRAPTPMPTPVPGPTPTPTPVPVCEFPRISINGGALFTNSPNVTLSICAPRAVEMMLSNDGGFTDAQWEPYAESKSWTLSTYGRYVLPRFVYAAFKDADGTTHGIYFDDIIHDPNPPEGSLCVGDSVPPGIASDAAAAGDANTVPSAPIVSGGVRYVQSLGGVSLAHAIPLVSAQTDGTVDIFVNARDDNSGLAQMQFSSTTDFGDANWEPYSALKPWVPEGGDGVKMVYARFRDAADNASAPTEKVEFALDTLPPYGGIAIDQRVVGPDTVTTTVFLGAVDNLSGVEDMRISADPYFSGAPWQKYTTDVTWPIWLDGQRVGTLYVQYRDLAYNLSDVYSDTYVVDTEPPVLYVEVPPADTLTRTVTVLAYDELTTLDKMRLSNDPLMIGGTVTLPYTTTVQWAFDDRRVVWVQAKDSVGNWSEPYPAYARLVVKKVYLPVILR